MRRRGTDASEVDDFYSPGTDLVLCILVAAVLLLVLVAVTVPVDSHGAPARSDENGEREDFVPLTPSEGHSPFQKNGYELTQSGVRDLINGLKSKRNDFVRSGANTLLIEGFASADPSAGASPTCQAEAGGDPDTCWQSASDRNLDLAFARARQVWQELVFAQAMPRWCTTVVVHGRNRSRILRTTVAQWAGDAPGSLPSEEKIREWDHSVIVVDADDPRLAAERKVEIRAIHDPRALCNTTELAAALDRLAR